MPSRAAPPRKRQFLRLPGLPGIGALDASQIHHLVDLAKQIKDGTKPIPEPPPLRNRRVLTLFFEPSSRTKLSFQIAGRRLGAEMLDFAPKTSSIRKGESLRDTARTLEALGIDALIVRHPSSGAPHYLSRVIRVPVVNAGDGSHEHPTQALLDLLTIREHFGRLTGLTIAILGDVLHSRVARSNIFAHSKLGNRVLLVGPPTLVPEGFRSDSVEIHHELDRLLPEADVVMALRLQRERMKQVLIPSEREYRQLFGLDEHRLKRLRKGALVMHPGPVNRDVEITGPVVEGPRAAVNMQVSYGIHVRMAVLLSILGDA